MIVSKPARAAACAIPRPIWPAPSTPMLRISMVRFPLVRRCGPESYDIPVAGVKPDRPAGRCPGRVLDTRMPDATTTILGAARAALAAALEAGRRTTASGKAIDEHQVHAERLAYAATEVAAAEALAAHARERAGADPTTDLMVAAFAAETADRLRARIEGHREDF